MFHIQSLKPSIISRRACRRGVSVVFMFYINITDKCGDVLKAENGAGVEVG